MTLKSVVLPDPLGPIIALSCPCCIEKLRSNTAANPPKKRPTPTSSRIGCSTTHSCNGFNLAKVIRECKMKQYFPLYCFHLSPPGKKQHGKTNHVGRLSCSPLAAPTIRSTRRLISVGILIRSNLSGSPKGFVASKPILEVVVTSTLAPEEIDSL